MKRKMLIGVLLFIVGHFFTGCLEKKDPLGVSTHPENWNTEGSVDFHGNAILSGGLGLESCRSCHGESFTGGSSNVSCFTSGCHTLFPHPDGFADYTSPNFHKDYIAEELSWDIIGCRKCHGADYSGEGYSQKNCLTCHTSPGGPEACNTCHGNADNPAPPVDLHNHIVTTTRGVGAHQPHLVDTTWTNAYPQDCQLCHVMPSAYNSEGHIDGSLPSEVVFNEVATDSGKVTPVWNSASATCSNTYCHGNFVFRRDESAYTWAYSDSVMTGNNPEMIWTSVGTGQDACETCHGLPPVGHIDQTTCHTCHGSVVDEEFNIIDKSLHINGKIDVF